MCAYTLDDPPLRPLDLIDHKADAWQVVQRLTQQVVGLEAGRERLQQPLATSDECDRASHVLEQQQLTAGAQDPEGLGGSSPGVGNRAEAERAGDRVEALVGEIELLHVTQAQIGRMAELLRALASDREHLGAELDAGELDIASVVRQVAGRAAS